MTDFQSPKYNLASNSKHLRLNRCSKIEAIFYFGLQKFIIAVTCISASSNFCALQSRIFKARIHELLLGFYTASNSNTFGIITQIFVSWYIIFHMLITPIGWLEFESHNTNICILGQYFPQVTAHLFVDRDLKVSFTFPMAYTEKI
jgi:hypothetical protein